MHTLARLKQSFQKLRPKLIELLVHQVAHQVKHFLDFLDEDDLFGRAGYGPEFEQALDQRYVQRLRLLEIILDAQLKLCVVGRQCLHLVERDEHSLEEKRMFGLQGCRQARRDRRQDLKELRQPVVRLDVILVDHLEQHVHNLLLNILPQRHKLAINAV